MLLIDDEDELLDAPNQEEKLLIEKLGLEGLRAIDESLLNYSGEKFTKVARVIIDALNAGSFNITEESVDLHARRIILLVNAGMLEAQGNLKKPRFSEIRNPNKEK